MDFEIKEKSEDFEIIEIASPNNVLAFKTVDQTIKKEKTCNKGSEKFIDIGKTRKNTIFKDVIKSEVNEKKSSFVNSPTHGAVQLFEICNEKSTEGETNSNVEEEFIGFDEPTIIQEQYEIRNEFGEIIEIYQPTDYRLQQEVQNRETDDESETKTATAIKGKPFKCEFCEKSYSLNNRLRLHVTRVHLTNVNQPFKCKICSEMFYLKMSLKKHIKDTHAKEGIPTIKCKFCNKHFSTEIDLTTHIKHIHLKELNLKKNELKKKQKSLLRCPICKKLFPDAFEVQNHLCSTHMKKCIFCDETFNEISKLKAHLVTNHKDKVSIIPKIKP